MKRVLSLILAAVMLLAVASVAMAEAKPYISVISKGEQHAFWQAVRKGANDAAEAYNVEMYYYGPPSESDVALQVEALNGELAKKPVAIALASLSTESVLSQLVECVEKNIPVIGFDSGVPNAPAGAIKATASTNNKNAAALAADEMIKHEGFVDMLKSGTVEKPVVLAVLSQEATSESITSRTTGFVERMKELASEHGVVTVKGYDLWATPDVKDATIVVHVEISATADSGDVKNAAESLLNQENLKSVFLTNEGAVTGFLAATNSGADLADDGKLGALIVAGFDAGATQKNAVRQGWFIGSVTQDPYRIGYLAVELAAKAAKGETVEDVDTGAKWYTAANIEDPDIALLVYE